PVAELLANKRLLIVNEGALQYIPFSALPSPLIKERPETELVPLIIKHEIVSLPSISLLAPLRQELASRQPAPKTVAVIADPVFHQNDSRIGKIAGKNSQKKLQLSAKANRSYSPPATSISPSLVAIEQAVREIGINGTELSLPRLPFTRQEAEAIFKLVPQQQCWRALDFEANKRIVISNELSQYRIIQFSTHGLLNSLHPELSGIVLSLVDSNGQPQDGFLQLHEIYNLNLPAELVVLSACQTGLGKEVKGEGLIGLTRGFMYAGTPRVVASLWKVNDRATAELMSYFYQGMLTENKRPAAALRAAQIRLWNTKRWHTPYYWAAFQLQGEWR
ncbi:MAG: CHAT domain-containing protein, partial [Acidobacteriota bacterium]